jgi:nitrate/TMAO reductase-like tetraheme cytochrome c subunit/mono/diheme cytochrome c family protein
VPRPALFLPPLALLLWAGAVGSLEAKDPVPRGETLFRGAGCASCHGVEAAGVAPMAPGAAPDLSGFRGADAEERAWLLRYLAGQEMRDGRPHPLPLTMPEPVRDTVTAWLVGSPGSRDPSEAPTPAPTSASGSNRAAEGPLAWPGARPDGRGWMAPAVGVSLLALATLALLFLRPAPLLVPGGLALGGLLLLLLPGSAFVLGAAHHLERSQSTEFCLSCHVMEAYGQTLVSEANLLAASHFQARTIPRDQACYACHTRYTMYGDVYAKALGLKHLYVNYLGTIPTTLSLYEPYQNRECLHCHTGARSYEEVGAHQRMAAAIEADERSCLSCHVPAHGLSTRAEGEDDA